MTLDEYFGDWRKPLCPLKDLKVVMFQTLYQ